MAIATGMDRSDKATLERLNQEYLDAFMNADVETEVLWNIFRI
jgi:hypothetical protein